MEEHESPITTPPPTHQSSPHHSLQDGDNLCEAEELRPIPSGNTTSLARQQASTARDYAESTARNSSRSPRSQQNPRWYDSIRRWWASNVRAVVSHDACRDHLANERTFLAYLRTSLAFAMLGVVVAQLFRLQHSINPSKTFGYFVLGKPLAAILEGAAMLTALVGAHRFWRQQTAMTRGKCWAGGWELVFIGGGLALMTLALFILLVGVDLSKEL